MRGSSPFQACLAKLKEAGIPGAQDIVLPDEEEQLQPEIGLTLDDAITRSNVAAKQWNRRQA